MEYKLIKLRSELLGRFVGSHWISVLLTDPTRKCFQDPNPHPLNPNLSLRVSILKSSLVVLRSSRTKRRCYELCLLVLEVQHGYIFSIDYVWLFLPFSVDPTSWLLLMAPLAVATEHWREHGSAARGACMCCSYLRNFYV